MNKNAQGLFLLVLAMMPSPHLKASLKAVLYVLLSGGELGRAEHSRSKSPSALSRFLNLYEWNLWGLVRRVRRWVEGVLLEQSKGKRGPKPRLLVIVDMSCSEKEGEFPELPICYNNHKRGLHYVVLYLVLGEVKLPWGLRVWRGAGTATSTELALKLIASLPLWVHKRFRVLVLADGGFGVTDFLNALTPDDTQIQTLTGIRYDRKLVDGRSIHQLKRKVQQVQLKGLNSPVWCSWFSFNKPHGSKEKRYLITNFYHPGYTMPKLGALRWAIEQFFKLAKQRFSLHRFGQRTALGVSRFIVLSLLAYLLTHLHALHSKQTYLPDWRQLAQQIRRILLPEVCLIHILVEQALLKPHLDVYHLAYYP